MSEFTPGPWRVQPLPPNCGGCRTIQAGKSGEYRQAQWQHDLCSTHGIHNDSEDAANARLIAAAPDLLNACEQALSALQWIQDITPDTDLRSSILLLEHALNSACD